MQQPEIDGASAPEGGRHRVECVDVDLGAQAGHVHVTRIGTAEPGGGRRQWSLVDVVSAWRGGATFWIGGTDGSSTAEVRPSVCPRCRLVSIETAPAEALHVLPGCAVDLPDRRR